MTGPLTMTPEERFWAKVDRTGECWLWLGSKSQRGYGHAWFHGRFHTAQRIAYLTTRGVIPEGMQIDHLCRNPPCVRPDHLEPVTPRTNVLRSPLGAGERARRTHCPQGHEYTPENTRVSRNNQRACRACQRGRKRSPSYRVYSNAAYIRKRDAGQVASVSGYCAFCKAGYPPGTYSEHALSEVHRAHLTPRGSRDVLRRIALSAASRRRVA